MTRVRWSLFLGLALAIAACGGDDPDGAAGSETGGTGSSSTTQLTTNTTTAPEPTVATSAPASTDPAPTPTTSTEPAVLEPVVLEHIEQRRSAIAAVESFLEAAAAGQWEAAAYLYDDEPTIEPQSIEAMCPTGCRADINVVEVYEDFEEAKGAIVEIRSSLGSGTLTVRQSALEHWVVVGDLPSAVIGAGEPSVLDVVASRVAPSGLTVVWPGAIQRFDSNGQSWTTNDGPRQRSTVADLWIWTDSSLIAIADPTFVCAPAETTAHPGAIKSHEGRWIALFYEWAGPETMVIDCASGAAVEGVVPELFDDGGSTQIERNGVVVRTPEWDDFQGTLEREDGTPITSDLVESGWQLAPDGRSIAYMDVTPAPGDPISRTSDVVVVRSVEDGSETRRWQLPTHSRITGFDGRFVLALSYGWSGEHPQLAVIAVDNGSVEVFETSALEYILAGG